MKRSRKMDSDRREKKKARHITEEGIADYLSQQKKKAAAAMRVNLNEKFVWRKKIERDLTQGVLFSVKSEKKRQKERMAEIEKMKKRREERAIEKAQHEEEMALLARERARADFQYWEKKEDDFHFYQSKLRSEIRVREGRIKAIDVLTKHLLLNGSSDDFDIEINEVFKGLAAKEMEEIRDDIKMHLDRDMATPTHREYWESLLVVCDWELAEVRKKDALDRARLRGGAELLAEERGVHSSIEADVKKLLQGKSYSELKALESQTESLMRSGTAKVVEFWEAILKRLHIYKAMACLRGIHSKLLHEHLQHLKQPLENSENDVEIAQPLSPEPILYEETHEAEEEEEEEEEEESGSFSPELLHGGDDIKEAIDPEEDKAILERKRMTVLEEQQRRIQAPDYNLELKAMKAMGVMEEGDAVFGPGAEVNLDSQVYHKYQPRKPKYLNRVHTGYEWNKYNQMHYNQDNRPPKMVQGYKFNLFYPDVDKTPGYTIENDGNAELCIIRFHAVPPYEDIAFRIVNKEWEFSNGFKCTFERGILCLYFNFKRYRYRR